MDITREKLRLLLAETNTDMSALSLKIGRNKTYIQQYITKGIPKKLDGDLRKEICMVLGKPENCLEVDAPSPIHLEPIPMPDNTYHIIGEVQAGVWSEAKQWHEDDWIAVEYANKRKYKNLYALRVRGESMNKMVQDGEYIIVVPLYDYPKDLKSGLLVVVERCLKQMDICELTLKELVITDKGAQLWPRSFHTDFQEPLDIIWPYTGKQISEIETVEIKGVAVYQGRDLDE